MAQQWANIDDLRLWEKNYNRGQISRLKKMFRRFGFNGALRLWNGVIMAGNNSTIALRELRADGWTPAGAGLRVDKGAWQVAYLDVSHLSQTEAEAFALSDNHASRIASPDMAQMAALVGELEDADKELIEVVFTADELDEFAALDQLAGELSFGFDGDSEGGGSGGKRVGHERAKQVKVVVPISDLATVEAALLKTGEVNRGDALLTLCKAYLNGKK